MIRNLGKVMVTGADGFIGSHLVEKLVQNGEPVTAVCIYNSTGNFGWLSKYTVNCPKNLNLVLGDIRDPYFMNQVVRGHDTVFHLAALIAIPYSYVAPTSYIDTNVSGTLNVAQACVDNKVGRMIHTSTSEVYGTAQVVPISEKHPLQGQSPYSASKIGADKIVEAYYKSFGLEAITLRPFNTYGPRQSLRAIIPTILSQVLAGATEVAIGDVTPTRDFTYVEDTVDAFLALGQLSNQKAIGDVFNAGNGTEISIGGLVELIGEALGRKILITNDKGRMRPSNSEVFRLCADARKLSDISGWKPRVALVEGIQRVSGWLKENLRGVDAGRYVI
jgi:NAD dependent epimerase/dehydratase